MVVSRLCLIYMRRDAEVAPKCLLRSLVMRKKNDSLERTLEAKERRRRKQGKTEEKGSWESDHGGLHHHLIITEQCP